MKSKPTYNELEQQVIDLKDELKRLTLIHEKVQSSEKLHRITLENISDTVIITDDHGNMTYVCPNTTMIFGLSPEEIRKISFIDRLLEGSPCKIDELKSKKEITNIDWTIADKDGNRHYLLINIKAVNINGGTALYVIHDITDRRQAELELEKSEKLFRSIVNELPQFIAYADKSLTYRFINPTYQEKFGLPADQIVGRTVMEVIGEAAFVKARPCVEKALSGEACKIQGRFNYAVGGARDIDGVLIPSVREDGQVQGYYTVLTDMTSHMKTQNALRHSESKFRSLIRNLPGVAFQFVQTVRGDFRFDFVGEKCHDHFGITSEEIMTDAKIAFDLIAKQDLAIVEEAIRQSARDLSPYAVEVRIKNSAGEMIWVHTMATPRRLESGDVLWDGIALDVTEKKKSQEALLESYRELKLNQKIANLFLTSSSDRLFNDILKLLLEEFECDFGYFGYIDEGGNLVVPSMTDDVWSKCQMTDKKNIFPKHCWAGLWGKSLQDKRSMVQNSDLEPPEGHLQLHNALVVPSIANGRLVGQFALANKKTDFTVDDQMRLETISDFIAPILHIYIDKEHAQKKLRFNAKKIQEQNIALKVLIENRHEENQKMTDAILNSFERLVFPYFEKLRKASTKSDIVTFLDIVETNTHESLSPLEKSTNSAYGQFTPTEIQVADLIKAGKSSKQIAEMLNMSPRSVFFHRNNIRKKLRISNKKANLRSVLSTLS